MLIRLARPEDNEPLCALSAASPMSGEITVAIERTPDYFAFYDLFGENGCARPPEYHDATDRNIYSAVVAVDDEKDNKVVGVIMTARQWLLYEGKTLIISRPEDGRIDAEYRGQGLIKKMGFKLLELFPQTRYDLGLFFIIRGNVKAESATAGAKEKKMIGLPVMDFRMTHISLYKAYKEDKGIEIVSATPEDRDAIVDFLREHYERYNFAPSLDAAEWDRMMRVSLGYGYEHIHLLRENGRIEAMIGLWDDFAVRRYVMLEWPFKVRFAMFLAKIARAFVKAPVPPRLGEPMRTCYLKHFACRPGAEEKLQAMLKILTNRVRCEQTHHSIWGAFAENDPLGGLLEPFLKSESVSRMYMIPGNTGFDLDLERIRSRPIYADFTMV